MKRLIAFIILSFVFQMSFGQACGPYRLVFSGEIENNLSEIKYIKLPNTFFLHGVGELDLGSSFIKIKPENNKIDCKVYSHITSIYTKAEQLFDLYRSKRPSFPIIINLLKSGKEIEIVKQISWDDISIKVIPDNELGTLFKIEFKKIKL